MDVEITENIMSEEQYNELLKAYTKEALASMIKADIRSRLPEPYESMYCQQFDKVKNIADFFEFAAKLMRRYNIYERNSISRWKRYTFVPHHKGYQQAADTNL